MDWTFQGEVFNPTEADLDPKKVYSFVYLITNTVTGRWYVGKKLFWFSGWKKVKGKRKRIKVQSDWRTYYGSNVALAADVKSLGEDKFTREILTLCASKSEASYLEAKQQILRDAILTKDSYNDWICVRTTRRHLAKHAARICGLSSTPGPEKQELSS